MDGLEAGDGGAGGWVGSLAPLVALVSHLRVAELQVEDSIWQTEAFQGVEDGEELGAGVVLVLRESICITGEEAAGGVV